MLRDELPNVIRNLEAEEETLEPKVRRTIDSHRLANDQVAQLKERRNVAQKGASALLKDVKNARDVLAEGDGMINLDPNWKKV